MSLDYIEMQDADGRGEVRFTKTEHGVVITMVAPYAVPAGGQNAVIVSPVLMADLDEWLHETVQVALLRKVPPPIVREIEPHEIEAAQALGVVAGVRLALDVIRASRG